MSRKNRNTSLDAFRDDPEVCVILISITAGGLGLTVTKNSLFQCSTNPGRLTPGALVGEAMPVNRWFY